MKKKEMLISLSDQEYLITCAALTVYTYLYHEQAFLDVTNDADNDIIQDLHHRVIRSIDGDCEIIHNYLNKLSIIGNIESANFSSPDIFH